jgi:hypothetical protein
LWFVTLTTVGLVASFALPVVSDASTATKVVLSISHIVVALIIVPPLTLALPPGPSRSGHGAGIGTRRVTFGRPIDDERL